jgi:Leucine-rich repeat (LRR) protein
LGANRINYLGSDIKRLRLLEVLYLGGNYLSEIPWEVGDLKYLKVFVLCENRLESIPSSVSNLKQLKSLLLHRNRLTSLPVELIRLRNLMELSLRDNPLVVRFVRDMVYNPPSLMELSARVIKIKKVPFKSVELPENLADYLHHAHECINPRCKGVYFDTRVEHIKFVDFCGKYRVPLLQYLCSPTCHDYRSPAYEASDSDSEDDRIRKVLLG